MGGLSPTRAHMLLFLPQRGLWRYPGGILMDGVRMSLQACDNLLSLLSVLGIDCQDIAKRGQSQGDGLYLLDPDGGSHSNAFLAYCDMTSYNGGWTMCYTTDEYVKPKTEVTYSAQFPYGSDGYRTNCNNISVS